MRTLAITSFLLLAAGAAAQEPARGWPRAIPLDEGTLLVYTPQLDKLEGVLLSGRAAVSWEAKGATPVFGVFWFDARVLVNKERRTLNVEQVAVTKVRFPNATPEQEERVARIIEAQVPRWDVTPSLDDVQANIAATQRAERTEQGIAAAPPRLVFSTEPAVLLLYDGPPAVRPMPETGLERVVNTPLFVVRDPSSGRFYLGSETLWYDAPRAKGPWKPIAAPPGKVKAFFDANPPPKAARQDEPVSSATPASAPDASESATKQPAPRPSAPPKIVVATEPTELVVFDGKPSWVPLTQDGKLLYADNTDGTVLVYVPANQTFVLVSGRWYRAASLAGPWTAVRPDRLPQSFKAIPPDSAVGDVRTFVAGTDEAEDALADTQIPQTTAVKRDQRLEVTYDGEPSFKAIEGTSLAYAVNTPFSVIRDSGRYWCCHQAVWYVAPTPTGPWAVSDRRPPSIDQVPPSAPVYDTKYVYVYEATPTVVYVGYLPGYVGVYPYYGTVVYGTGYAYPPYIGPVYCYPRPATFGIHVSYSSWTGWGVGVNYGTPFMSVGVHFGGPAYYGPVGYHPPPPPPYGYRPPPPGYRPPAGAPPPGYRPPPGGAPPAGARPPGSPPVAGAQPPPPPAGTAPPARTGGTSSTNIYDRPGNVERNAAPAQAAARRPPGTSTQPNNVYGDRSGNVYRQNPGGGWDQRTAGGWQQAGSPQRQAPAAGAGAGSAPAGLTPDAAARSRSVAAPHGPGAAHGGAPRGGGRGGRR